MANENTNVMDNARLWSEPSVITGHMVSTIAPNEVVQIISGPTWGRIRQDIDASGWWWEVSVDAIGLRGWLWQDRLGSCQP